ncbi:YeiH family protein [Thalassotalea profundi]|uniref:UPF0324 membrane protein n=1 Tax=Thalassotalea profundi TaxID=2036687 RepID=A0ABQ3IR90_9GAMM|nr:YeiH family protein [Thalassotalea profundi]GHE88445.1 UPF0324 membrane protein [Thalassotalea profundi]
MSYSENRYQDTLKGILLVALLSVIATVIAMFKIFQELAISPLIIGIVIGIIYANTLRHKFPIAWQVGISFSTKTILRAGIVFYGFRLTFQNIAEVGLSGVLMSLSIVVLTFLLGYWVGTKLLKMDRDTTILISAGSSICGAAAVLATEPVIKAESYKTSIAVATVVIFGTIAMFLYPFIYSVIGESELLKLSEQAMGIYLGGTLHEVAHVVGAGHAINNNVADSAVIVKMLRVMLLAPFLLILCYWLKDKLRKNTPDIANTDKAPIMVPWFAIGFIAVVAFNSLNVLPQQTITIINHADTFILTMAMTALGMDTCLSKFEGIGLKPIYLASALFTWLFVGGYLLTQAITQII